MQIHRKRAILICGGQLEPSLKNHNGQWCQTIEEQAEAFAIDLERHFRPFDTASAAHCRRVESGCSIDKLICLTHRAIIIIYGMPTVPREEFFLLPLVAHCLRPFARGTVSHQFVVPVQIDVPQWCEILEHLVAIIIAWLPPPDLEQRFEAASAEGHWCRSAAAVRMGD
ncbi:hypothetical protein ACLKA6_007322 [Drosophila palustris]